jgi:hypothetical protein
VILGSTEQPPETVLIHDLTTDLRRTVPVEAFMQAVARGDSPWPA